MRSFLSTVLLAIGCAVLGGAAMFVWGGANTPGALQERLDSALTELSAANSRVLTLESEKRRLELELRAQADCGKLNDDPPVSQEPYVDELHGIALQMPYNEKWGYSEAGLAGAPFLPMEGLDGIQFGPPYEISRCAFAHGIQLTFLPARGSGAILADARRRNAAAELEEIVIGDNDIKAYRYRVPSAPPQADQVCADEHVEIPGPRFNFVFSACRSGAAALPGVLKSIELLE